MRTRCCCPTRPEGLCIRDALVQRQPLLVCPPRLPSLCSVKRASLCAAAPSRAPSAAQRTERRVSDSLAPALLPTPGG